MTVKDIKLKYCVGVLPMNMVFANVKEDNTQRIYDAADNKGSEELVSEKTGGKPSAYSILCGGDSIKKNLTPEEKVSNTVREIIKESAKVKNEGSSLIVKKDNILKATGALLTELKNEVEGKYTLTEIEIENQFLYFLSDITMGHFVANKEGKFKETISRNFRNILKNKKQFDVVVNNGEVTIKSKKGNIINGFRSDDQSDIMSPFAPNINDREGLSPKKEESPENSFEQNYLGAIDNSDSLMEKNNQYVSKGSTDDNNLDNVNNGMMCERGENEFSNCSNPSDINVNDNNDDKCCNYSNNNDSDDYSIDPSCRNMNSGMNNSGYTSSTNNITHETAGFGCSVPYSNTNHEGANKSGCTEKEM